MRGRHLLMALAAVAPGMVVARQIPTSGARDMRMRTVNYDPRQVVRLSTVVGTALVVTFGSSEHVSAVAVTDSKNLAAMPRDNFLFLKSRDLLPTQPVVVLTKGPRGVRRYVFEIEAISAARQAAEQRDVYYSVEFHYPVDRAHALLVARQRQERLQRVRLAQARQARAHSLLEQATKPQVEPPPGMTANWHYVARGSRLLTPSSVYDNGFSTFFRFRGITRMPAIFRVDPSGGEAAVNATVRGDWMVVSGIAAAWRLRDGKANLSIWNRAYDRAGRPPATGTVSSAVRRIVKGETQ